MRGTLIRPRNGRKIHDRHWIHPENSTLAQFGARHADGWRRSPCRSLAQETVHTDIGDIDKTAGAEHVSRRSGPIRPGRDAISRRGRCSATRISTQRFPLTPARAGARLGPRDAYRFAKGEEITASSGQPVKLSRPLDFLVVADHSDNHGLFPDFLAGKPEILQNPKGRKWYEMIQYGKGAEAAWRHRHHLLAGQIPARNYSTSPAIRPTGRHGKASSMRPRRPTIQAGSPPSSASSGRLSTRATTFTATSSFATVATRPGMIEPYTTTAAARQQQSARSLEVAAQLRGQDGRQRAGHRPQRQPQQRHHVSDDRVVHRQGDRPRICRAREAAGRCSTKRPR